MFISLYFAKGDIKIGKKTLFKGMPIVTFANPLLITIGKDVILVSKSHSTALGVSRPVILRTLLPNAAISIGDGSGLSGTMICAVKSVSIGMRYLIGAGSVVTKGIPTEFVAAGNPAVVIRNLEFQQEMER